MYHKKNFEELSVALYKQMIICVIMLKNIILENSEFNLIILLLKMANYWMSNLSGRGSLIITLNG